MRKKRKQKIVVRNSVNIYGASEELVKALYNLNRFKNPQYTNILKYGNKYALRFIDEYISLTKITETKNNKVVKCPRGTNFENLALKFRKELESFPVYYKQKAVEAEWPESHIDLSDEQEKVKYRFIDAYQKDSRPYGNYLFIAATSFGKSIAAMSICSYLNRSALVIYNTNLIKEAWLRDAKKMFNVEPKQVGIIQGSTYRIGEFITLASVQTLGRRKDYWKSICSNFGILVVDEADLMGKNTMSEFVYECDTEFVLGMSATTSPENDYKKIFEAGLGTPFVKLQSKAGKDTMTSLALRDFEVIETEFEYHGDVDTFNPSFIGEERVQRSMDYNNLLECLSYDEDRNQLITESVIKEINNNALILVICKRVGHAEVLVEMIKEKGHDAVCYTGADNSNKNWSRKIIDSFLNRDTQCLVTIDSMVQRGANLNAVDTMFIVAPIKKKTALHQLIGRLRRRDDKKTTNKVYYFHDKRVSFLKSAYHKVVLPVIEKEGVIKYRRPMV